MAMRRIGLVLADVMRDIETKRAGAIPAEIDAPAQTRREAKGEQARAQAGRGLPRMGELVKEAGAGEAPASQQGDVKQREKPLCSLPTIGRSIATACSSAAPASKRKPPASAVVIDLLVYRESRRHPTTP